MRKYLFLVLACLCIGLISMHSAYAQDASETSDPLLEALLNGEKPPTDTNEDTSAETKENASDKTQKQTYALQHPQEDVLLPDHEGKERTNKILDMDLADIPEEYLIEADEYRTYCQKRVLLNTYYDCECMSLSYLEKRIEMGPAPDRSAILMKIGGTCVDVTNAAGLAYRECMDMAGLTGVKGDVEAHCSCIGNNYAKIFKSSGAQPSSRVFSRIKSRANTYCRAQKYTAQ